MIMFVGVFRIKSCRGKGLGGDEEIEFQDACPLLLQLLSMVNSDPGSKVKED